MVALVLHAMWVPKLAITQPQVLCLLVHFTNKCFNIVFMALSRILECMLDNSIHVLGQIGKVINLTL